MAETAFPSLAEPARTALALAICSAVCFALPLFFPLTFPLAWVGLVPLLFALHSLGWKGALVNSLAFGISFHGLANYWLVPTVVNLTPFTEASPTAMHFWAIAAFVGLLLWQSVFVTLFSMTAWAILKRRKDVLAAFAIGAAWLLSEWLRSLGTLGYPWALLSSTQVAFLPVAQSVAWVGSYGLGAIIVTVNALLFIGWERRQISYFIVGVTVFLVLTILGLLDLRRIQRAIVTAPKLPVAVVQGNFGMERWRPDVPFSELERILQTHLRLSEQAVQQGAKVIVWSETALPWALRTDGRWDYGSSELRDFAERHQVVLVVGAGEKKDDRSYNACFAFASITHRASRITHNFVGVYHKMRLVPFGEYVPWQDFFPWLKKWLPHSPVETTPGRLASPLAFSLGSRSISVAVVICFESLFPFHLRQILKPVPRPSSPVPLIVVITNDSWFGKTLAPYHHARASILRAIEARRSLVRCAGTGISLICLPTGKVIRLADWNERAVLTASVPLLTMPSPYHRIGDLPFVSIAAMFLFLAWRRVSTSHR